MAQPKRLRGISYDQVAVYFITTVTLDRVKVFTDHEFAKTPFVRSSRRTRVITRSAVRRSKVLPHAPCVP